VYRLGILSNLERLWRCSGSSSIASPQTGFWRSLKGFMVCSKGSIFVNFGHLGVED
jgi:hypothetical protein